MKKVVIIGGGISGLSTAYYLSKKSEQKNIPIELVLIEKNNQLGGNIVTDYEKGFLIEGGPDCFISEKPYAIRLCEELGLSNDLIITKEENKCTYILNKGKLVELPDGLMLMIPTKIMPFVFSPLISIHGKIRMGLDLFIPKKDDDLDESLGSFVRRRLGQEALDKIAEPLIAGIHAGDPESMSVRNTFPRFMDMEKMHGSLIKAMLIQMKNKPTATTNTSGPKRTLFMSLKGGLAQLINNIHEKISTKTKILLNKKIDVINKIDSNNSIKYEIKMSDGSTESADYVIITSPAYETGRMINNFDSDLSDVLNKFPYVSTATMSVGFKRSEVKHDLHGFGFVIPRTEKRKIMATTWTSEKFPYRNPDSAVLLRAFLGGVKNPEVLNQSDDELLNTVLSEWKDIMGIDAKPIIHKTYRFTRAMPQYILGHENTVKKIDDMTAKHKNLIIAGNFLKGVGISDCIFNAENTAEKIVNNL